MAAATFLLIGLLAGSLLLRLWLAGRQISHLLRHGENPSHGENPIASDAMLRAGFMVVAGVVEGGAILALTLGGGIAWLERAWRFSRFSSGGLIASVVLVFLLSNRAVHAGQSWLGERRWRQAHRVPERKSPAAVLSLLLAAGGAAAAGQAVSWLIDADIPLWWLWTALLTVLGLKFSERFPLRLWRGHGTAQPSLPLTDPVLKPRLAALLTRCGMVTAALRVIASPAGSRNANARLAGTARLPRIEMSSALLALLTPEEIDAIVAHEAGHWRCRHPARDLAGLAVFVFAGFALLALATGVPAISHGLGVPDASPPGWLALAVALLPLARFFLLPARAAWRRRFEFEADAFAAAQTRRPALMAALAKLNRANATPFSSDPIYAGFFHFHPDAEERIRRLQAGQCPLFGR